MNGIILHSEENEDFYIWETEHSVFLSTKNTIKDLSKLKEITGIKKFYSTDQIHSEMISIIEYDKFKYSNSDGLIAFKESKHPLLIRTADCMPVFISSPDVRAILHAGRKGVQLNIFKTFFNIINKRDTNRNDLIFFFGPHICSDCYEIDKETGETFPLYKKAKNFLLDSYIRERQIINSGICTLENEKLFSYRRDGTSGRIFNLIIPKDLYRKYIRKNLHF